MKQSTSHAIRRARPVVLTVSAVCVAGAVLAHTGVKNPAVMGRMESMKAIAAEMKTLGEMAKGATPFNQAVARAAAAAIAEHAADTPALYEAAEDDPLSEARPEIWTNFADFTVKSDALVTLAQDLSTSLETKDDLPGAMKSLGNACQACHKPYRE